MLKAPGAYLNSPEFFVVNKGEFPRAFPAPLKAFYKAQPIGYGSRMVAYPSHSGLNVLRVPFQTEADLVAKFGASSSYATEGTDHPVSQYTIDEIRHYERMKIVLGPFTVGVTPFSQDGADGKVRTYSVQRRIYPKYDSLLWPYVMKKLSTEVVSTIRNFIVHVRMMIAAQGQVIDLVGENNVVLDERNNVWVIDVNNIRPVLNDDEWLRPEFRGKEKEILGMMRRYSGLLRCAYMGYSNEEEEERVRVETLLEECRASLREVFADGYWDDHDQPVADSSVSRLRNLELCFGFQTEDGFKNDQVHKNLFQDPLRLKVLKYSDITGQAAERELSGDRDY